MLAGLPLATIAPLQHVQNALLAWFSSWVLTNMPRWASSSCIGCRSAGGSRLRCAVSCTWSSTGSPRLFFQCGESRRLRSSTSLSLIFVVVGLLSAAVVHQVQGARHHAHQPFCVELIAEGLTCCHWSWTFQHTTQDSIFNLAFCVVWRYGWVCNAPITYVCNGRTINPRTGMTTMMMMMMITKSGTDKLIEFKLSGD